MVTGGPAVRPVVDSCIIKSSGDDGMVVAGRARPTVRDCDIFGRKNGLRLMGEARGEWIDCKLNVSHQAGVKAADRSRPTLRGCHVQGNLEEGVVAMDEATVELVGCHVRDNKGPGLDVSGRAAALLRGCWVRGNCGGAFVWDAGRLQLRSTRLGGGTALALLADRPEAAITADDCVIEGGVHAAAGTWAALRAAGAGNRLVAEADAASGQLPPEEGPFVFVPDRFRRKQ